MCQGQKYAIKITGTLHTVYFHLLEMEYVEVEVQMYQLQLWICVDMSVGKDIYRINLSACPFNLAWNVADGFSVILKCSTVTH